VVGETEGLFTDDGDGGVVRFLDQRNHSVMDVISYGISGAYRLSDSFSVGAGLVYYDTSFEIQSDLYFWDDLDDPMGSGTSYLPEYFVLGQTLFGDDQSFGLSAGILWRISQRWSVGGRYRQGPEARMSGQARAGSILDLGVPPGTVIDFDFEAIAEMPDNYGIGTAYRSNNGRLTIGFEWDRVTYSKTPESLELDDQTVDDADQLHLGAEWVFLQSRPLVAIRAGIWHEPDHQTRANDNADDFTRAHLRPGDDQLHYALGVGIALKNFQVDGALDFSDAVNTGSLSVIFGF
jgi:hypothetical protein